MDERRVCSICGKTMDKEEEILFDGDLLCEACYEENTVLCDNCNARIWRDCSESDGSIVLCGSCYDNHYTSCETCGRLIRNDDAYYDDDGDYGYCHDCYHRRHRDVIHSYSYKPYPKFYGQGGQFIGVELEIDKGGEDCDKAEEILDVANYDEDLVYAKHDGSLMCGFEIVSHPMTLDYHKTQMPWGDLMDKALELGYQSHNTDTCGLHFHVNRGCFGETEDEQDAAIGRVVYFVEKHWSELVKFSRRKEANLNRWAARYATISTTAKETYEKAKDKCYSRYVAVNLTPHTVEMRMFRGTLRYQSFLATLELVSHICSLAALLSDADFEKMSWLDFVQTIDKDEMPDLIEYLKSKRLYVNEPAPAVDQEV